MVRLLDLFCGAGGAAMGYHRAGFDEIVGIDIVPQPNFPFRFVQRDITDLGRFAHELFMSFDLIHASPPCQAYSFSTVQHRHHDYSDLVPFTQRLLSGYDYVIENVPGSPLGYSITLCGSVLGHDRIHRHRHFETSWMMMSPGCNHNNVKEPLTVVGHSEQGRGYNDRQLPHGLEARKEAMGIDWMTRDELTEAIPPSFTEYIGRAFLEQRVKQSPRRSFTGTDAGAYTACVVRRV